MLICSISLRILVGAFITRVICDVFMSSDVSAPNLHMIAMYHRCNCFQVTSACTVSASAPTHGPQHTTARARFAKQADPAP